MRSVWSGCSDIHLWFKLFLEIVFQFHASWHNLLACCCHTDAWYGSVFCSCVFFDGFVLMSVKPLVAAAWFLCCIDFHCTQLVSLCCCSGVWCVALAIVLTAPVTAAALLLSRPPVGKPIFDVKHLDGSHSASGFTASHWAGQQPCQRNTADGKVSYIFVCTTVCAP